VGPLKKSLTPCVAYNIVNNPISNRGAKASRCRTTYDKKLCNCRVFDNVSPQRIDVGNLPQLMVSKVLSKKTPLSNIPPSSQYTLLQEPPAYLLSSFMPSGGRWYAAGIMAVMVCSVHYRERKYCNSITKTYRLWTMKGLTKVKNLKVTLKAKEKPMSL
jgi:hypothetical protein